MTKLQFQVLYREFLFRVVDRDLLSADAQGGSSRLLGRFAAILILLSLPFAGLALSVESRHISHAALLRSAWGVEHTLFATTMLVVGLFAVLSWDSAFPDRRDVLVLAPLPLRAGTLFTAKVASLAAALSLTVALFNTAPSLLLALVLAPPSSSLFDMLLSLDLYRVIVAYWITALAAGGFILCSALTVQGLSAQLPRRMFLRLSAFLQLAAFCLLVCVYFLQPSLAAPAALVDLRNQHLLHWLPSYWFLGLFQQLDRGSDAVMSALAWRAWAGLAVSVAGAASAFLLSYFRTLRKIVEEPDIAPTSRRLTWLPPFGGPFVTAIVQFSIRTLFRSRQHRMLLTFYAGIGFSILILFSRTSEAQKLSAASGSGGWYDVSLLLLASSFVMMCCWMLGMRAVFGMPLELKANWIFRITPLPRVAECLAASRRAMFVLALAPIWIVSAIIFLGLWPWRPAIEHLAVLGLPCIILVELCMHNFAKLPFVCSYLPGKSNLHMTVCLCLMGGLNVIYWCANFERRALAEPAKYAWILAVLSVTALGAWWRTTSWAKSEYTQLLFEEEATPAITGLGLHRDGVLLTNTMQ